MVKFYRMIKRSAFNRYSAWLKEKFGESVRKITIDGGFTCPNRDGTKTLGGCIYCNNSSFNPNQRGAGLSPEEQLKRGIRILQERYSARKFIAYLQPYSNTYKPLEELKSLYHQMLEPVEVVGMALGTRPDCLHTKILDLLDEMAYKKYVSLEIGLQSSHDKTLRTINRGHSFRDFRDVMELCRHRKFDITVHVILGLPGEDRDMIMQTISSLNRLRYDSIKIHNLHVVKDTPLEKKYREGQVKIYEFREYIPLVCDIIEILPPHVTVQRISGEAPPEYLIAPRWCLNKTEIYNAVEKELANRNTRQAGKYQSQ
jgi:radical SAM protein (TIGR01212 family)